WHLYWRHPSTGWPRALPLQPERWQAPPLAGRLRVGAAPAAWLWASATPCGLATGGRSCWRPWSWPIAPTEGLILAEGMAMAARPLSSLRSLRKMKQERVE
ncbi:hypothetical protein BHM03_00046792, partial [Ensete ventricosum]